MDTAQVTQIRRECVQRVLLRRRPLTTRTVRGIGPAGWQDITVREIVRGDTDSEFMPATSVSEWIDDMCATALQWRGDWTPVLAEIAEAARAGEREALAALGRAGRLDEWSRWHLYAELRRWRDEARLPACRSLMSRLIGAWEDDHGWPDTRPGEPELGGERPDPPRAEQVRYPTRFGQPAGMPA